jgi:hypothetical protein
MDMFKYMSKFWTCLLIQSGYFTIQDLQIIRFSCQAAMACFLHNMSYVSRNHCAWGHGAFRRVRLQ